MTEAAPIVPNFIGGQWNRPKLETYGNVYNPSTGEVIGQVPFCGVKEVDEAVEAASKAFVSWSNMPVMKRSAILFRYRELMHQYADELIRLVTKENGKTIEESKGDVRRGIEVIEFCCGIAHLSKGESVQQLADELDAVTMREAIGVCAGITPFNFPAMVPLWMYPMAIACGNTFILKPSEKVPLTAVRMAELFQEAGLPDGVLNIVHGGREVVDALCTHPKIAAVSFVGSTRVAKHVYETSSKHGKRCQSAGGAKNVLLVMPDAEPESTMRAVMGSAFGNAGQRCMAGSVIMGIGKEQDDLRDLVLDSMRKLKMDDTLANPKADMGPVIDGVSRDRIRKIIAAAPSEGAKVVEDGTKATRDRGFFVGPTLIDHVQPPMSLFREEIFGPVLSMLRPQTLDEAIKIMNSVEYGNGASIFTTSGAPARKFVRDIQCGMLGVNIGVPAAMALFSFSGWNQSFFGDLHVQGIEGMMFYTRQKTVMSRWDSAYVRQHGW
ncbi:MAG TPA: CoA-acylating methylmalonate-semialdehyde dehydrogenase [Tepidisphaeraceae bacterium]|jgi:malonate-semialdehyde dehydrogenase (acetylating)/methylmalonate-semialdehyde dehydrogenase|nr:CoA-acylating methylmalonate-semialdehyde dehydrogenase [Tepidisphaeraceae bacterium]